MNDESVGRDKPKDSARLGARRGKPSVRYRMKLKPGVLLALQQSVREPGDLFDAALGHHPELMAVVNEADEILGYNFYGFPQAYVEGGRLQMPCDNPMHLVEVDGYPPMELSELLKLLAGINKTVVSLMTQLGPSS